MKALVISDTHIPTRLKEFPPDLIDLFKNVDQVIALGDFVDMQTVLIIKGLKQNFQAVHGNMDYPDVKEYLPPKKVFATENIRIGICHGWGPPFRIRERIVNLFKEKPDVILYGHTHLFDDSLHNDVRFLNPGAVCDGSCALLEIDGGAIRFEQIRF